MSEFVPEEAIGYDAVFARGGRNVGDEDFAFFKCPSCDQVYLLDYEVDTAYLDGNDLSRRAPVFDASFTCAGCNRRVPRDQPWIGPKAPVEFRVTWKLLRRSAWSWAVPNDSVDENSMKNGAK